MYRKRIAFAISSAVAASFLSSGAQAGALEEVIVTAQHRAQNVQDVPIAVTAMSGEMMAKADIFDLSGIAQHTPGLSYSEFAPGQVYPALRGISSADDGAGLDNSAALFLDGVYIGRSAGINFDMFDLERIEVLRGPQGTLFGRNAIGGAINVVSQKPTQDTHLKFGATVGNEGILRYQGLISGGLSDNVAGKITFSHREHDGYVRNVLLNKDLQDEDSDSVRGQLVFSAGSSEWTLTADYMEDDRDDMGRTPIVEGNYPYPTYIREEMGTSGRENAQPVDGFSKREAYGVSLQGVIEFDSGVFTTITAFRHGETDWEMASIGAPAGGKSAPDGNPYGVDVIDDIEEDIDTFSQEFRWTSNQMGNFNYTAGLFFFTEETDRPERFRLDMKRADIGQFPIGIEYTRTENETTSYAAYGQANWELSDTLRLTVGARYTVDEKDYRATAVNCGLDLEGTQFEMWPGCLGPDGEMKFAEPGKGSLGIIAEAFIVEPDDDWNDFSPMVSLQYTPSGDTMFFATVSKGYKSGGFAGSQGVEVAATTPVDPEDVINYEIGVKSDITDTFRINASAFYMDYQDLQVVRFGPVPSTPFGTFITTNIGEADIQGLEAEFTWYPTENLRLGGFYAYLDTDTNDLEINGVDYSGAPLTRAPENSYNLNATYTVITGSGTVEAALDYSYTDEQRTDYIKPDIIIEEQKLWDARISWTSSDETWNVSLWGKNLADEEYISHMYTIGPGGIGVWGAPRTYGVTATWSM
ncbi:MAG: TonB-dependent receptor [Halieaceae bacterium]|jgi:iron complex outermembrane recepter protein|nr:TonB-dependent receptor [Halieaceae bacterium]